MIKLDSKIKNFIDYCKRNYKKFKPRSLEIFYNKLNSELNKNYNLNNHVNRYYRRGKKVLAIFPYTSDKFYMYYSYCSNTIYLIGNEDNLSRIILDFLTTSSKILPLHSSAIGINQTALCILSDSGCGKTSFMLKLLEKHFSYITDDSLFSIQNKIYRVSNIINVRKDFAENKEIDKYIKKILLQDNSKEKIQINLEKFKDKIKFEFGNTYDTKKYIYMVKDSDFKENRQINIVEKMKEPFPSISNHSYWCMHYLINNNFEVEIKNTIKNSIQYWNEELKNIEYLLAKELWENGSEYTEKIANI